MIDNKCLKYLAASKKKLTIEYVQHLINNLLLDHYVCMQTYNIYNAAIFMQPE